MNVIAARLQQLRRYPSAVFGMVIISLLIIVSVVTPIAIPYDEAVRLWRGGEEIWRESPRNAWPVWYNWFSSTDLPETIVFDTADGDGQRTVEQLSADTREARFVFEFDFPYEAFAPELILFTSSTYEAKPPYVEMTWFTPDDREIRAGDFTPGPTGSFRFAQDSRLQRRLERETGIEDVPAERGLFDDPAQEGLQPLQGTYRLEVNALLFEEESDVEITFVSYGLVHGWAGTDHRRRDLMIALLWGTPIAMAFGLLAALGTTITTMAIA
ncbi:MAG: hypothetical protein KC441_08355, partial [Anaerolineales bacterium]|nr:hypothetical protein [Anaerolineales bacterium]